MKSVRVIGFTLVELMVVVLLIGIIMAFAIPAYGNYTKKTRLADLLTSSQGMQIAVSNFALEEGRWPTAAVAKENFPFIKAEGLADISDHIVYLGASGTNGERFAIQMILDADQYGSGAMLYLVGTAKIDKANKPIFSLAIDWKCEYVAVVSGYLPDNCEVEFK